MLNAIRCEIISSDVDLVLEAFSLEWNGIFRISAAKLNELDHFFLDLILSHTSPHLTPQDSVFKASNVAPVRTS